MGILLVDLETGKYYGKRYYEPDNWTREVENAEVFDNLKQIGEAVVKGTMDRITDDYTRESYLCNAIIGKTVEFKEVMQLKET